LRAVHAWKYVAALVPAFTGYAYRAAESVSSAADDRRQAAEQVLELAPGELAEVHDLEIERVIGEGPAAQVLIDAVGEDDLLVVGSRGHGGFADLLLGSVSQQCAHHAPCPVVIVRGTTAPNAPGGVS
jgi:nucleotide-binding universal stress UspA family protein